jgi:hypothetical protein
MNRSNLQRLLKGTILWFMLLQVAVVVLALMIFLLEGNGSQDETTTSVSSMSNISRRLQLMNGQWYTNPCSWGTHQYCWSWQPNGEAGNGEAVDNGMQDDAWSTNDDAGWSHYDDLYHNDEGKGQVNDDGYHGDDQAIQSQDDYHYDDQYWNDDYYKSGPIEDDDYVYSYEPVPDASIINTSNGGYGGRRGRSLSQIRFNKCPPVMPGYATTSWRYQPSELRHGSVVSVTKNSCRFHITFTHPRCCCCCHHCGL